MAMLNKSNIRKEEHGEPEIAEQLEGVFSFRQADISKAKTAMRY